MPAAPILPGVSKVERLLNLVALLLDTRRPLTVEQVRKAIYPDQSDGAFHRMFERDKEELRDLGIPIERVPTDAWEVEEGYLIDPQEAALPELGLTPDEQAALWLAARAWRGDDTGRGGALKLLAGGEAVEGAGPAWLDARVEAGVPNLGLLLDAISRRKRVSFPYRTGGSGPVVERHVRPHALTYRGGWYLAGHDEDRGEVRHFKLSRMEGSVAVKAGSAPDFEPPPAGPALPRGPWEGPAATTARVAFGPKSAWWVARRTGAATTATRDDGWAVLDVPVGDEDLLVGWVLGFADDAEILEPEHLRREAIRRLEELAGAG